MTRNYFFVAPSLPPLSISEKPPMTFEELMNRLEVNLNKNLELRFFIDICNIRLLLLSQ